jgi:DHA2 family multidrug resistance protein
MDFSAFRGTNFTVGSMFSFTMGVGLYGLTYRYPLYLASICGYDSLMIGQTVIIWGWRCLRGHRWRGFWRASWICA